MGSMRRRIPLSLVIVSGVLTGVVLQPQEARAAPPVWSITPTGVTCKNSTSCSAVAGPALGLVEKVTPFIFDDEFSATTLSSAWTAVAGGNASNRERECYSPENVSISGGSLHETAAVGSIPGCYCPPASSTECPYTSGAIQWASLSFTYGTISVRAKFAGGQGTWPAIWLLGADCQQQTWIRSGPSCDWPAPGSNEIDIAEILNSDDTQVNEQIHTENSSGTRESPGCRATTSDASKRWHTYTLIWTPQSLTWEIDGHEMCRKTSFIPQTPMFLIINTAVGGIGAGPVKNSTLPQTTDVDYVRVT
jgi:beta-glucanase (GH16 family)